MDRREFIGVVAFVALAVPLVAETQAGKVSRIGILTNIRLQTERASQIQIYEDPETETHSRTNGPVLGRQQRGQAPTGPAIRCALVK